MLHSLLILFILFMLTACQSSPDRPVSAAALSDEYERSSSEVRSKYNGLEITVSGYALRSATMPKPGEDQGSVLLDDRERNVPYPCVCWFSKGHAAAFSKINGGQYVTVSGVFSAEGGANLKFCNLVKIENPPN